MSVKEDKQINKKIANKIKEARIKKGWMQSEVAKKAGIDSNSYAKIERGEEKPFGVTLVKIKRALGIKSSDILPD